MPPSLQSSRFPPASNARYRASGCGDVLFAAVPTIHAHWLPAACVASTRWTRELGRVLPGGVTDPGVPEIYIRFGFVGSAAIEVRLGPPMLKALSNCVQLVPWLVERKARMFPKL